MGIVQVAIVRVAIVLDGNCPRWELSSGNFRWELSGWELSGWELSGWELSGVGIVRGGNCPVGIVRVGVVRVGIVRESSIPTWISLLHSRR